MITELNYHPPDATPAELDLVPGADDNDFEFVELSNIGSSPISLDGVRFTEGIQFAFADSSVTELAPGESILVVKNAAAFTARYGGEPIVAGQFAGGTQLANNGEQLVLIDGFGRILHDFVYDDEAPWPTSPDGGGPTLEIIDPLGDYSSPFNWRASATALGTPGRLPNRSAARGDFNADGRTDGDDFLLWQAGFGTAVGATAADGDANGDGAVDGDDFLLWQANFSTAAAGNGAAAEPLADSPRTTSRAPLRSAASRPRRELERIDGVLESFENHDSRGRHRKRVPDSLRTADSSMTGRDPGTLNVDWCFRVSRWPHHREFAVALISR